MTDNKKEEKWYMSTMLFASAPSHVDMEKGIIEGVAIVTAGEAKGHNVWLDSDFIDDINSQGNELKQGLKARFGHPNMSSTALGTFLGRIKNFRRVGDTVKADMFLSNSAKEAPGGNLYNYVLNLANEDPEAFGMSIVFEKGDMFQFNVDGEKIYDGFDSGEKTFVELKKLLAADFVDSPAANPNGLFSQYNNMTLSAQVTEFLDTHPEILDLVSKNPEVIEKFTQRYNEYRKLKGEKMTKEIIKNEELEAVESAEALNNNEELTLADVALEEVAEEKLSNNDVAEIVLLKEFIAMSDTDGYEFAKENFGKGEAEILKIKNEMLKANNELLKSENEKLKAKSADIEPITFTEENAKEDFRAIVENKKQSMSASQAWSTAIRENQELYKKFMNKEI